MAITVDPDGTVEYTEEELDLDRFASQLPKAGKPPAPAEKINPLDPYEGPFRDDGMAARPSEGDGFGFDPATGEWGIVQGGLSLKDDGISPRRTVPQEVLDRAKEIARATGKTVKVEEVSPEQGSDPAGLSYAVARSPSYRITDGKGKTLSEFSGKDQFGRYVERTEEPGGEDPGNDAPYDNTGPGYAPGGEGRPYDSPVWISRQTGPEAGSSRAGISEYSRSGIASPLNGALSERFLIAADASTTRPPEPAAPDRNAAAVVTLKADTMSL